MQLFLSFYDGWYGNLPIVAPRTPLALSSTLARLSTASFQNKILFFNSNLLTIFFQHSCTAFFWDEMAPHDQAKKTKPSEKLAAMIDKSFGSFDEMKAEFEAKAAPGAVFGSGWVWLAVNLKGDEIKIVGTPNQDNPLMKGVCDEVMLPILGLDVWEHGKFLIFFLNLT